MVGQGHMAGVFHLLHLLGPSGMANEAHICHANILQFGTPGNASNSLHQSGSWAPWPFMSPIHLTPQLVVLEGVPLPLAS